MVSAPTVPDRTIVVWLLCEIRAPVGFKLSVHHMTCLMPLLKRGYIIGAGFPGRV